MCAEYDMVVLSNGVIVDSLMECELRFGLKYYR